MKRIFTWADDFSDGMALVQDKWGYINPEGEVVIPPVYDEAKEFSEGIEIVRENGKLLIFQPLLHLNF